MGFSHIAADLRGKWGNEKKESLAPLIPNLAALVTPFLQKGGGGGGHPTSSCMPVRINKFPHDKERRELSCYIPRIFKKGMPLFCHVPVLHFFLFFLVFLKGFRRADPFLSYFSRTCVGSPPHLMSSSKLSGRATTNSVHPTPPPPQDIFLPFFPGTSRCLTQGGGDRREWIETNASPRWTKQKRPCRLY